MLVLSRKQDQDIVIGDNIRIRILKIKGNTIRIGVDAPRDIKVVRGELEDYDRVGSSERQGSEEIGPEEAEVTIVFSNESGQTNRLSSQKNASTSQTIPFTNSQPSVESISNRNNSAAPPSVKFRESLPAPLHHNRLKELVKDLTRRN